MDAEDGMHFALSPLIRTRFMMKHAVFFLCVLALVGCGKSNPADHYNDVERNLPPLGELGKSVQELLDSEWAESCDSTASANMKRIARALDERKDEITEFGSSLPLTQNYKLIPFGKSFLREYTIEESPKDEWQNYSESWSDLAQKYQKIKNQPVNQYWLWLNNSVRSIIRNDQMRILDGSNLGLKHDSASKIDSLLAAVEKCVQDVRCLKLQIPVMDEIFAHEVDFYSYYFSKFNKTQDRNVLERFVKRLKHDQGRYAFFNNETIKISKENNLTTLQLPVDGAAYDADQKKLVSKMVESVWKDSEVSVKLNWMDSVKDIFKMFFELDKPGERAYVIFSDKEVHLFPFTGTRAIAHEFGHVLGFRDHYYTTWDYLGCKYNTEYNLGDLMSDSDGNVTADEWKDLKKNYLK
jgi:hypothetical protein